MGSRPGHRLSIALRPERGEGGEHDIADAEVIGEVARHELDDELREEEAV
jgi:hypothetical protein